MFGRVSAPDDNEPRGFCNLFYDMSPTTEASLIHGYHSKDELSKGSEHIKTDADRESAEQVMSEKGTRAKEGDQSTATKGDAGTKHEHVVRDKAAERGESSSEVAQASKENATVEQQPEEEDRLAAGKDSLIKSGSASDNGTSLGNKGEEGTMKRGETHTDNSKGNVQMASSVSGSTADNTSGSVKEECRTGGGCGILMTFLSGDAVSLVDTHTEQQIMDLCLHKLARLFPEQQLPEVERGEVTRWSHDPLSRMAYSFLPVHCTGDMYDKMAQNVHGKLFFAGEGTSRQFPQSVSGAFLSGLREAHNIAQASAAITQPWLQQ